MIPPQANIRVNRKFIEQEIAQLETVVGLKKRRIYCLEQRSLRERQWITHMDARMPDSEKHYIEPTIGDRYTQALKDYYDSEVQIMKVDLMQMEMELNIKKAMLEDGLSNLVKPQ